MFSKSYDHKVLNTLISFVLFTLFLGFGVIQPAKVWASDAEPSVSVVATSVSLALSSDIANPGDNVTASGSADPNTWVSIKIVGSAQGVVFFDAIKSGADGTYSYTFKVPTLPGSTLTVATGYGSKVATKNLIVNNSGMIEMTTASPIVGPSKVWTIKLSGLVNEANIKDNIQISNSQGIIQLTNCTVITENGLSKIKVNPGINYTPGDYTLWVRDIASVNGTKIKNQVYLKFTVK